jgi:hypothetical protein
LLFLIRANQRLDETQSKAASTAKSLQKIIHNKRAAAHLSNLFQLGRTIIFLLTINTPIDFAINNVCQ